MTRRTIKERRCSDSDPTVETPRLRLPLPDEDECLVVERRHEIVREPVVRTPPRPIRRRRSRSWPLILTTFICLAAMGSAVWYVEHGRAQRIASVDLSQPPDVALGPRVDLVAPTPAPAPRTAFRRTRDATSDAERRHDREAKARARRRAVRAKPRPTMVASVHRAPPGRSLAPNLAAIPMGGYRLEGKAARRAARRKRQLQPVLVVMSSPPSMVVELDGVIVGRTPLVKTLAEVRASAKVAVYGAGFERVDGVATPDASGRLHFYAQPIKSDR